MEGGNGGQIGVGGFWELHGGADTAAEAAGWSESEDCDEVCGCEGGGGLGGGEGAALDSGSSLLSEIVPGPLVHLKDVLNLFSWDLLFSGFCLLSSVK